MSSGNGPSSPDHKDGSSSSISGAVAYVAIASFVGLALYFAFYFIKDVITNLHERRPSALVSPVTAPDANNTRQSRNLGLDLENISLLPTFPYQPMKRKCRKEGHKHKENVSTVECAVCLDELEEGEMVKVLPVCKHYFHVKCIDMWLSTRSSCPMCRAHPEPEKVRLGLVSISPPWRHLMQSSSSERRQFSFGSCLGSPFGLGSPFAKTPGMSPSPRTTSPLQGSWQGSPSMLTTPPRDLQQIPAEARIPENPEIREIS